MKKNMIHVVYIGLCGVCFFLGTLIVNAPEGEVARGPASMEQKLIGSSEDIRIGEDKFFFANAKVDTGADTSSLHATDIEAIAKVEDGKIVRYVKFKTTDDNGNVFDLTRKIVKEDVVRNANGESLRYFIRETVWIGHESYAVEINLVDRSHMKKKFLIGKQLIRDAGYMIDVGQELLASR